MLSLYYIYDAICEITTFYEFWSRTYGTETQGCHLADNRKNTTSFVVKFNMLAQILQFSGGAFRTGRQVRHVKVNLRSSQWLNVLFLT